MKHQNNLLIVFISAYFFIASITVIAAPREVPEEFKDAITVQKSTEKIVVLVKTKYTPSVYSVYRILLIDETTDDMLAIYSDSVSLSGSGKFVRIEIDESLINFNHRLSISLKNYYIGAVTLNNIKSGRLELYN